MTVGIPAGAVFVDVVPSFTGFPGALRNGLVPPADRAGGEAGNAAGDGLSGGFLGSIKKLAGPLTAAFAAIGIGAIVTDAVTKGMENEKITDRLAASLGASGPEAEKLGRAAGELYAGAYGESMDEVSDAIGSVIGSISGMREASSEDLKAVTADALNFAGAMGVDVGGAAQSAGNLIKQGLATDATGAFDLLTAAAQKAGPSMVEPILDASNEYATNFAALGFSGEQAFGALVAASQNGEIAVDKTGDALKEFTIRATDMSTGSVAAYQAIGLNAQDMANAILAGGDTAQGATQQIVDGLLGIKDPATQANTAIALFGTPLEDIGVDKVPAFLASLKGAEGGLGDVAGAADRMGDTLNDNAASNIESFKRQLSNMAVNVIGGQVLPFVDRFASFLATTVGPVVQEVGGGITAFIAAFRDGGDEVTSSGLAGTFERVGIAARNIVDSVIGAGKAIGSFVSDHSTSLSILAGSVGGAALAFGALYAIQQAIAAARFGVFLVQYAAQVGVVNLATKLWAGTQAVLNAVMALNPVTLVVLAIGALIGILAVLFVKNQGFHDFVVGLWGGIKDAIGGAVSFITDTVFPALSGAVSAVGEFFRGFYDGVILPVWEFIRTAFEFYIGLVVGYIGLWITAIDKVVGVIRFLYDEVVSPVFQLIGAAIAFAWTNVIEPVFSAVFGWIAEKLTLAFTAYRDLVVGVWNAVRDGIVGAYTWVRDNVFTPVVDWLGTKLSLAFNAYRDLAVGAWTAVRDGVSGAWTWLRDNVFEPVRAWLVDTLGPVFTTFKSTGTSAWTGLRDGIRDAWAFIRDNVFSPLKQWITVDLPGFFSSGVDLIGKAWDALKDKAKEPVRFLVNTVINDGIIDRFNDLAGFFGTDKLTRLKLPEGFATGGAIRGRGTATSDSILARLSHGEHVLTARDVANMGGHSGVFALREFFAKGMPGFAKGGIVDLGKWFEGLGARVTEHPAFGGVHPVHKGRGHYEGRAIDVNFGPGGQNATEMAFFDKYAQQVRDMGFKVLWRVAGHFNHLHAEAASSGFLGNITDALGSAASSIGSTLSDVTAPFTDLLGKLSDGLLSSPVGQIVGGAGKKLIDSAVGFVTDKAKNLLSFGGSDSGIVGEYDGATGSLSPNAARAAAKSMIPPGWSFDDLDKLWTRESGWRWNADNPSSSAYGIPQALPGSKMKASGADWLTNAITQIEWGLGYIGDRYGNSSKAWAHSERFNWYRHGGPVAPLSFDSGGYLPPGYSTVYNGTRAPEPVFTAAQGEAILSRRGGDAGPTFESLFRDVYPREEVDVDVLRRRMGFALAGAGLGGTP